MTSPAGARFVDLHAHSTASDGAVAPTAVVAAARRAGLAAVALTDHDTLGGVVEAMAEAGSMLGSGSIIVFDDATSIVELALRTARFYHHESCGKCSPCREGTNWTVKILERMIRGEATPIDLETTASVQTNIIGNCLCVLGDSMAMPVGSMVQKFREEFMEAIQGGLPDALAA